jgi:hypothetical protein
LANIQASIKGWSTTEASNQPDSTDATTLVGDLRAIQAGIRYFFSQDTIASAATTDLGSKEAGYLSISGTTTITSFGTVSAGIRKYIKFDGALTLTHNGTSLILPTAANITTVAGDVALMESLGSGNWRCLYYQRASGAALVGVQDGEVTFAKLASTVISGATAETAPAVDDLLLLSDTSASTVDKITLENMLKVVNALTEDTSPDVNADYLLSYDASASAVKKVLMGRANVYLGSGVNTTSGTSYDFTGIPAWVKRITINITGLSTSGTSVPIIQIGDSGGIETSNYNGTGAYFKSDTTGNTSNLSSGFAVGSNVNAASVIHGAMTLTLLSASTNLWCATGVFGLSDANLAYWVGGSKALSAVLDRIRLTTTNGTDTFDAGAINILYE